VNIGKYQDETASLSIDASASKTPRSSTSISIDSGPDDPDEMQAE
jgi:hypothetical protein